jgi:molybdopterin-guanine dinucleotide biosynthesis protein MobB
MKAKRISTIFIGIVGQKKSGKTTLVEKLAAEFKSRGLAVGTIKYSSHDLEFDSPGKDTYRHRLAGSSVSLIKASKNCAIFSESDYFTEAMISEIFKPCNLVFIEGDTKSENPKIYVSDGQPVRSGIGGQIIAFWGEPGLSEKPSFDNIISLADFICDKFIIR